jgi:hypothetical protein
MLPFDFTVHGVPISAQTKNRGLLKRWRDQVHEAAAEKWPSGDAPLTCPLKLEIKYFYERWSGDVDNIIKPVQDALIGVVYIDDRCVTDSSALKRNLNGSFRVKGVPLALVQGFSRGVDFIYVRISEPKLQEPL